MGDDQFQLGSGSWWDTSRNRSSFDSGTTNPPVSISTTLNTIASFGSTASSVAGHDQSPADVDGGGLDDQNLQMMGLGLSSQNLDWNQALFRGEKAEGGFRSLLQEDYNQQKLYSGGPSEEQINRPDFSLDQTAAYSSQASSNDDGSIAASGFQVDFHAMLLSENQPATYQNRSSMNYQYPSGDGGGGYGAAEFVPSANKYLQFSRASRAPPPSAAAPSGSPLHFTNNTPFWNASAPAAAAVDNHPRSSFFPAGLQTQQHQIPSHPHPSFDDKPKTSEYRDVNTKKISSETSSNKRTRGNETPNPLPAFKARKEKMGDRITALQQLVSPFGKTDTASVLSEAIAYIKFLHEQVSVLSNPYMKNGAPTSQHHQQMMSSNTDKSKDPEGAPRQDLRSRGLCLVPVSSTFPMTHETTVDFWTPTFGGTFR